MGKTLLVVMVAGSLSGAAFREARELVVTKHDHFELAAPVRTVDAVQVVVSGSNSSGYSGGYPYPTLTISRAWS